MVTAKRSEGDTDLEFSISILTDELSKYPIDVVRTVCRDWAKTNKWFPTLSDLIKKADDVMGLRVALLEASKMTAQLQIEKREEKKMAIDKRDFYADPRDNPIRRELCNFLILKGEEDHFQEVRMWSNYQLELSAKAKGWTGSEESQ